MSINLFLLNMYLHGRTFMVKLYNYIKSLIFSVEKLYVVTPIFDEQKNVISYEKNSIYAKYLLVKFIKSVQQYCKNFGITFFDNMLNNLVWLLDTKYNFVKLEAKNYDVTRNILMENVTMTNIVEKVKDVDYDINELMMNKNMNIVTAMTLMDKDKNVIHVKNLIDNYADRSKVYSHTLRNVLHVKGIEWTGNDVIAVHYLKCMAGIKTKELKVELVVDDHISNLYSCDT